MALCREEPGLRKGRLRLGAGASSSHRAPASRLDPKPYQGYEMQVFWKYLAKLYLVIFINDLNQGRISYLMK